jgi:formate hydrogenlyase subunit 3/multisubunit Na+/H+ antiporter MnhD subunit
VNNAGNSDAVNARDALLGRLASLLIALLSRRWRPLKRALDLGIAVITLASMHVTTRSSLTSKVIGVASFNAGLGVCEDGLSQATSLITSAMSKREQLSAHIA